MIRADLTPYIPTTSITSDVAPPSRLPSHVTLKSNPGNIGYLEGRNLDFMPESYALTGQTAEISERTCGQPYLNELGSHQVYANGPSNGSQIDQVQTTPINGATHTVHQSVPVLLSPTEAKLVPATKIDSTVPISNIPGHTCVEGHETCIVGTVVPNSVNPYLRSFYRRVPTDDSNPNPFSELTYFADGRVLSSADFTRPVSNDPSLLEGTRGQMWVNGETGKGLKRTFECIEGTLEPLQSPVCSQDTAQPSLPVDQAVLVGQDICGRVGDLGLVDAANAMVNKSTMPPGRVTWPNGVPTFSEQNSETRAPMYLVDSQQATCPHLEAALKARDTLSVSPFTFKDTYEDTIAREDARIAKEAARKLEEQTRQLEEEAQLQAQLKAKEEAETDVLMEQLLVQNPNETDLGFTHEAMRVGRGCDGLSNCEAEDYHNEGFVDLSSAGWDSRANDVSTWQAGDSNNAVLVDSSPAVGESRVSCAAGESRVLVDPTYSSNLPINPNSMSPSLGSACMLAITTIVQVVKNFP